MISSSMVVFIAGMFFFVGIFAGWAVRDIRQSHLDITKLLGMRNYLPHTQELTPEVLDILGVVRAAGRYKNGNGIRADEFFMGYQDDVDALEIQLKVAQKFMADQDSKLQDLVTIVLSGNDKQVADALNGKEKAINALVGQVIKAYGNKVNPYTVEDLVRLALAKEVVNPNDTSHIVITKLPINTAKGVGSQDSTQVREDSFEKGTCPTCGLTTR